jgi:hypothetical protein
MLPVLKLGAEGEEHNYRDAVLCRDGCSLTIHSALTVTCRASSCSHWTTPVVNSPCTSVIPISESNCRQAVSGRPPYAQRERGARGGLANEQLLLSGAGSFSWVDPNRVADVGHYAGQYASVNRRPWGARILAQIHRNHSVAPVGNHGFLRATYAEHCASA